MKLLTLTLLLLPFSLLAQFTKGDQYLGGSFSINRSNYHSRESLSSGVSDRTSEFTSLNLGPSFGYFINESVAVVIGASYSIGRNKTETSLSPDYSVYKQQQYKVSPGLRKYWTITDRFMFAASGNLFYSRHVTKSLLTNKVTSTAKSYELGIALAPTFIFFPSNRWSIEATLGSLAYSFEKGLNEKWHHHSVQLDYGTFNLGLAYYFRKKIG
jgi:hypothetical protein